MIEEIKPKEINEEELLNVLLRVYREPQYYENKMDRSLMIAFSKAIISAYNKGNLFK